MTDNTTLNPGTGGDNVRTLDRTSSKTQVVALDVGGAAGEVLLSPTNPMPVAGTVIVANTSIDVVQGSAWTVSVNNLPSTQAVSGSVSISGTVNVAGPLTDAQLRASALPVAGTFWQATQPVSGTVGISGTVPVSGPLTDTQLRATPVPVSGTVGVSGSVAVTGTFWQATQPVSGTVGISGTVPVSGPVTDAQLRASAVPVSVSNEIEVKNDAGNPLTVSVGAITPTASNPAATDTALPVVQKPIPIWIASFADVGASLLSPKFTQRKLGSGVGVTQAAGNLLVTTGTTTNAEFLARSTESFSGAFIHRLKATLSQRIVNNNFAAMLADKVGEGLAYNCTSATVVDVTLTAHGFTAANVGQFINLGGLTVTSGTGVPGRYAIASIVDANTIRFTVAGWATGTGTLDLFGWNYYRALYTGTTATNVALDAQRQGWASGDTTATINTTASPGHVLQLRVDGRNAYWEDSLVASSTTASLTTRASRYENLPDPDVALYLYLWSYNGTTVPASTTTWTVGFVSVEDTVNNAVYLAGVRQFGQASALPVSFPSAQSVNISTGSIAAGTNAVGDVGIQYRANATGAATPFSLLSPATPTAVTVKASAGRLVGWVLLNSSAALRSVKFWNIASGSVTLGTTAAVFEIDLAAGQRSEVNLAAGISFATAISTAVTGGKGLTDNTTAGLAANDVSGVLFYA